MRTLKDPVAGLPAGTPYRIEDVEDLGRCVIWRGPKDRMDRIEMSDVPGTRATLIYDAHVQVLGCNPEEPIPCGFCGELIAAALTVCPECGEDPGRDVPCTVCDPDGQGRPSGYINYTSRAGYGREELCFACGGATLVDAPHAGEREAALAKARADAGGVWPMTRTLVLPDHNVTEEVWAVLPVCEPVDVAEIAARVYDRFNYAAEEEDCSPEDLGGAVADRLRRLEAIGRAQKIDERWKRAGGAR